MPAGPRQQFSRPSRRISSTIRKLEKGSKSPVRLSRTRSNPIRKRSHSPRPGRSFSRRRLSPARKASVLEKSREDLRKTPKRPRDSSKNRKKITEVNCRSKSPREPLPSMSIRRQASRDHHSYSDRDDPPREQSRILTSEKKYGEKSLCERPKKFTYNEEELKKLTKRIYTNPIRGSSGHQINRSVIRPEDITIPRRPGINGSDNVR